MRNILLVLVAAAVAVAAPSELVLSSPGHIFLATLDTDHRAFNLTLDVAVAGEAPTWLAVPPTSKSLYAVDEDGATTSLYHMDLDAERLTLATSVPSSKGIVHLAFSRDGKRMLGAGYGSAAIDVFDTAGHDGDGLQHVKTIEAGTGGHPHQSVLDPSGRFFLVNDLGRDEVLVLNADDADVKIAGRIGVAKGCGPRHGVFYHDASSHQNSSSSNSSSGSTYYMLVCELKSVVILFSVSYGNHSSGLELSPLQTISTFAGPTPAKAAAAEAVLAQDNLYVSNRLTGQPTDSIAHFRVVGHQSVVRLELVGLTSTGGTQPRMFSISRDGRDLLVGNMGGELAVVALRRNECDGTLLETPVASIPACALPGKSGPAFVQQVA